MMSDNNVDLVSHSEVEPSSNSEVETSYLSSDHIRQEIIIVSDDYGSEKAYGNSLKEETSYYPWLLDAFMSNVGRGIKCVEVHMAHRVLLGEEVRANLQRGERDTDFI